MGEGEKDGWEDGWEVGVVNFSRIYDIQQLKPIHAYQSAEYNDAFIKL